MLPRELLGKEDADHRQLYDALRFLVDRAIMTGVEATEGQLTVAPTSAGEGHVEVRGRLPPRRAIAAPTHWVPLFHMDELDFTFERFMEACPSSLADAVERATLGARA